MVSFAFTSLSAQPKIPLNERKALIAFFNATNGYNWYNKSGWLGNWGTERDWFGVSVFETDTTAYVEGIFLYDNNLSGSIPEELGNLRNLKFLFLEDNSLTGSIPSSLGNLIHLKELTMRNNRLSGSIPKELGNLKNLEYLDLACNKYLSGNIPVEIGNLINLRLIEFRDNQLSGEIPKELGKLINLVHVCMDTNQLTRLPKEFGNLTKLTGICMTANRLRGSIPEELGNLKNLEWISLGVNELSGNLPPQLGNLKKLKEIYLNNNKLSGEIPSELGNLNNLKVLGLGVNELSGNIPPQIGNITNLKELYLNNNKLSGEIPSNLRNLSNLSKLSIGYNCLYVTDPEVKSWIDSFDPYWEQTQNQCGCLIVSLKSKYEGQPHFIENVSFPVEFTADVNWGKKTPKIVRFITPNGSYDVAASSSTVSKTFNIASDFMACTSLKAIAICTDGSTSPEKEADMTVTPKIYPGILVKAFQLDGEYYYNSSFGLNLVDESTKKVNSKIPLFGSKEFGLKFIPQVKAKAEMNGNVSINLDLDNVSIKKLKVAGFELSLNPVLQLNGTFDKPGCYYNWTGSAGLSANGKVSKTWPFIFTLGPIPIPMYTKASIGVSLNGVVAVEDISPVNLNGEFGPNITVRGTLGAGIDEVINVEGWIQGGADFVLQWPDKPVVKTLTISLTGGVSATAFLWEWENELLRWEWDIYGTDSTNTQELSSLSTLKPKLIPRDYLKSQGIFKKRLAHSFSPLNYENYSRTIASSPLQTSVLPYSHANLSSNDTQMSLVWVQDDSSRTSMNRTKAVYSSFNGASWSEPQPIWDDGTADFHPRSVTFSDGSVIAVWEDEKKMLSESAQFKDMLKNMEISVSVFNSNIQKWISSKKITSNYHFDFSPKVSGNSLNNSMIVWLSNESNELRGSTNAPNKIYYSKHDGINWTTPALAARVPMGILKYDFIYNGNKGYIVLSLDTDDDSSTINDHELYLLTYDNGTWSSLNQLTNDSIVDGNPRIASDSYGNIILSWIRKDGLYSMINFDLANKTTVLSEEYSSNLADLKMVSSVNGRLAMIWAEPSENNSDLYVSLYDRNNMKWTEPEQITSDSETERNITAAFYGENTLISIYNRNNIAETQESKKTSNGQVLTYVKPEIISTDLYMVKLDLEEEQIEPTTFQLNRTHLYFGAIINGPCTSSQKILLTKSGIGPLYWSASNNSSWLNCTPSSGINSAEMSVFVDAAGLSVGTYTGTITISAPNAANSQESVSVTLQVYPNGATTFPFGEFATPINGSTVRSSIPVTGWVLDDIGVESVKIYREEKGALVFIGDAMFVEGARPDVEQAYPGYPLNYQAGWGYMMLTNFLPNRGNGTFKIHAKAADTEGHQVTLATKTITCDNENAVKPFGAIDTPTQGGTASGSNFINWGWVLTPQPNRIPTDGSTINVYVDGVKLGHPTYNIHRSDIATLFPGFKNSNGAVGYFYLDTTQYANGVHTIQWTAIDDAGNSDGIGSRYFTVINTGSVSARCLSKYSTLSLNVLSKFLEIPVEFLEPVKIKRGLNRNIEPIIINPEENGLINVKIKELEHFEMQLSTEKSDVTGYMIANNKFYPLPLGSTLKNGTFYWTPGPGFIGEYRFIFVEKRQNGEHYRRPVIIKIVPMFTVGK